MRDSCKIFRVEDDVKIDYCSEGDNSSRYMKLSDNEDNIKMGEIKYKKNKYFFMPNIQEELEDLNGERTFSWLVFKGEKYPMTKNKYKIREGDIFRLARIFFIVRGIHVQKKKLEQKDTNCLISYHTQINESLNVNEDYNNYKNDDDSSSDSSNTDLCEENDNDEEDNEDEKNNKNLKEPKHKSPNKSKRKNSKKKRSKSKKKKKRNSINELKTNTINVKPKNINKEPLITSESKKSEKQKICRICYMGEIDNYDNPLIKPCKCSGSMKYIHYKCLLHWIKTKIQIDKSEYIENDFFSIYSPENVQCELCKEFLPHFIKHCNKLYNLTELEQNFDSDIKVDKGDNKDKKTEPNGLNEENYVVLDSMSPDKEILPYRYIVKFGKNNILKIGRGLDMNLILNDLSISRNHCQMELTDKGDIFMKDNNSKFGTLILVQNKSLEILKGQTLTVQAGRTYFNIYYKSNFSVFNCCNPIEIDLKSTYEKMNGKSINLEKNNVILEESDSEGEGNGEVEGKNKNCEEDKKESNEYENNIIKINNKKIKIMKISQKDKKKPENTDINIDNKDKEDNKESIFMTDHKKERSKSKKKSNKSLGHEMNNNDKDKVKENKDNQKDIENDK